MSKLELMKKINSTFNVPEFKFDPRYHSYRYRGVVLPSVTKVTGRWKKPFDAPKVAERVAAREGRTVEDVLAEWKQAGEVASRHGTEVHAMIEAYLGNGRWVRSSDPLSNARMEAFLDWWNRNAMGITPLALELRVFSKLMKIAGTMDFLGMDDETGRLVIIDWKTNKRFRTDKDHSFDNLQGPFRHLPDNEHNNYSLQTSLYKLILEEHGFDVGSMIILHLTADQKPKAMPYNALDFSGQIAEALRAA